MEEQKKKLDRRTAYPGVILQQALDMLLKMKESLGTKGPFSRESIAEGLGYSSVSGASARAIAALYQYGLLERSGNAYTVSEIGNHFLYPTDQSTATTDLKIAALSPKLFKGIYDKFRGQALPSLLANILVRDYGISDKVKDEVLRILKETFAYAGLLKNGIVIDSSQNDEAPVENTRKLDNNTNIPTAKSKDPEESEYETVETKFGIKILFPTSLKRLMILGKFATAFEEFEKNLPTTELEQTKANGEE